MNKAEAASRAVEMRRERSSPLMALVVLLLFGCWVPSWPTSSEAFVPSSIPPSSQQQQQQLQRVFPSSRKSTTQLYFNRWGSFGDFLNTNRTQAATSRDEFRAAAADDDDETTTAAGTQRLVTLPVQAIKPGGLRLFLMFYFMGMQNTPDRMSWKADQPTSSSSVYSSHHDDEDEIAYVVDMHFHDRTGVLSVELKEDEVIVERVGSSPSTQYLMQESVLIQGVLDELEQCAKDDSIAVKDRLILLEEEDAIEKAREALAFR